jgi:hypothetical protein
VNMCLGHADITTTLEAPVPFWMLERAMRRREGTVPVEELIEEEAYSEERLWWKVRQDIGNASYYLKKRWVFGDEADEIATELEAIEERVTQLARRVTQHHQRLFNERVPPDEEEE